MTTERNYEREADMLRRYAQGETLQEIADEHGLSRQRVCQILKRLNITGADIRERRYRLAVRAYASGMTMEEAAKLAHVTPTTLRQRLVATGQVRARVPQHGTYNEYQSHGCRCERCRTALADYIYEYKHRQHPERERRGRYGPRRRSA